jgi:phosphoserine phosphatase
MMATFAGSQTRSFQVTLSKSVAVSDSKQQTELLKAVVVDVYTELRHYL